MKKHLFIITIYVFMFLLLSFGVTAEETGNSPVAVSPGSGTAVVTIWQSCPTFSWSAVDQAASYQLAIFESPDGKIAPYENTALMSIPLMNKQITGPALSCTLSAEESLKPGNMYAWYIQALDGSGNPIGPWSSGKIFKVEQETRFIGVQEKIEEKLQSKAQEVEPGDIGNKKTPGISGIQGTEGTYNTLYGWYAGANLAGTQNTLMGWNAGYTYNVTNYGDYNTFLGHYNGRKNTTGDENTFVGNLTGDNNSTGSQNTFIGRGAGYYNTTASNNTYVGYISGYDNTTAGTYNSAIGYQAGYFCKGTYNTMIGYQSGYYRQYTNTASYNSFFGEGTGYNASSGNNNTYLGYHSGYNVYSGYDNTLLGNLAGKLINTGYSNTCLGASAGYYITTAAQNVFLGYNAAYNETGSNKLYIAVSDTYSPLIYGEFDNSILNVKSKLGIGTKTPDYPVELETTSENAVFVATRTDGAQNVINATASYAHFGAISDHPVRILANNAWKMQINSDGSLSMANGAACTSGGVWTNASSRALKENIENLSAGEAMAALINLNPVKYNYKADKKDKHVGFIAEDVPDLVAAADRKGLSPMDITAVLTKVIQELEKENQENTRTLSQLRERVAALEKK